VVVFIVFALSSILLITLSSCRQEDVWVRVKAGDKLTYSIDCEVRARGADGNGNSFLMPAMPDGKLKMLLEVTAVRAGPGMEQDVFHFVNHVAEFSVGGRKAMAEFGPDRGTWPSWLDPTGQMDVDGTFGKIGALALETDHVRSALISLGVYFKSAGAYISRGRFIYAVPIGAQFHDKPWALMSEKFICYKWTKDGEFANIEVTRSKYQPQYGDPLYDLPRVYVTGVARLSLKDGLLVSSDISVEDSLGSVHLVSKRLSKG